MFPEQPSQPSIVCVVSKELFHFFIGRFGFPSPLGDRGSYGWPVWLGIQDRSSSGAPRRKVVSDEWKDCGGRQPRCAFLTQHRAAFSLTTFTGPVGSCECGHGHVEDDVRNNVCKVPKLRWVCLLCWMVICVNHSGHFLGFYI